MPSVSIIGAGKVGITLGRLFRAHEFDIVSVCNRSLGSAKLAVDQIGAGQPVARLGNIGHSDILLITTSDNALSTIGRQIVDAGVKVSGAIAFHCSGATPAEVLSPLREKGAAIASVHPVKSFTDPLADATGFPDTWCGYEGDGKATALLGAVFTTFGAKIFPVAGENKALYHAGIVFMCNYLFPLIEAGLVCYEKAGVCRALAAEIVSPIMHATVDNALRLGPSKALTGPIARGDNTIVANQLNALGAFDPALKVMYEVMGSFATRLSVEKGVADSTGLELIRQLLSYDEYIGVTR